MAEQVTVTEEIAAPADRVWSMVADLTRMGEWSPENQGARWLRGATGPQPGAMFRGRNRNGQRRWTTVGRVVDCQPGQLLSFRVTVGPLKIAEWRYAFEERGERCRVTETWIDRRGRLAKALGGPASGVADRTTHNRLGMEETLRRLKSAAETEARPAG